MPVEFKLPALGENIEAADVAEILIAEGDEVEAEQVVMELETEKAVLELPCPYAGRVSRIHVATGDTIGVGSPLLTIEESDGREAKSEQPAESEVSERPAEQEAEAREQKPVEEQEQDLQQETKPSPVPETPPQAVPARDELGEGDREKAVPVPAGPATRRLAHQLGVDLRQVRGSGKGGRITQEDVQAHVRSITSGAREGEVAGPSASLPDFSQWGEIERQPLNKIARTSARNLSHSWRTIPHVTQHELADITGLEAARKRFVQTAGDSVPKITMTAIVAKALIASLKQFPQFNASIDLANEQLILKKYYHLGIAVDTPAGLMVPVMRNVDRKSLREVAAELADLAQRARDRKLKLDEMQGATFTISNQGGIGGTSFTPIVNHPEVAILGLSRSRKELRIVDGETANGGLSELPLRSAKASSSGSSHRAPLEPAERLMLPLSLSYDHRVINGADAARFMVKLATDLSEYFRLLVEC